MTEILLFKQILRLKERNYLCFIWKVYITISLEFIDVHLPLTIKHLTHFVALLKYLWKMVLFLLLNSFAELCFETIIVLMAFVSNHRIVIRVTFSKIFVILSPSFYDSVCI